MRRRLASLRLSDTSARIPLTGNTAGRTGASPKLVKNEGQEELAMAREEEKEETNEEGVLSATLRNRREDGVVEMKEYV